LPKVAASIIAISVTVPQLVVAVGKVMSAAFDVKPPAGGTSLKFFVFQ